VECNNKNGLSNHYAFTVLRHHSLISIQMCIKIFTLEENIVSGPERFVILEFYCQYLSSHFKSRVLLLVDTTQQKNSPFKCTYQCWRTERCKV